MIAFSNHLCALDSVFGDARDWIFDHSVFDDARDVSSGEFVQYIHAFDNSPKASMGGAPGIRRCLAIEALATGER